MTIKEFAKKTEKTERCVKNWIKNGYIPKADLEKNYVPNSAKVPLSGTRARKQTAICKAIVVASDNNKHVLPQFFKIDKTIFDILIQQLSDNDVIKVYYDDGVEYYCTTDKSRMKLTENSEQYLKILISLIKIAENTTEICNNIYK